MTTSFADFGLLSPLAHGHPPLVHLLARLNTNIELRRKQWTNTI